MSIVIKRDDSMRSFRLEKMPRPVGRPRETKSFKMCNDLKSFKMCK